MSSATLLKKVYSNKFDQVSHNKQFNLYGTVRKHHYLGTNLINNTKRTRFTRNGGPQGYGSSQNNYTNRIVNSGFSESNINKNRSDIVILQKPSQDATMDTKSYISEVMRCHPCPYGNQEKSGMCHIDNANSNSQSQYVNQLKRAYKVKDVRGTFYFNNTQGDHIDEVKIETQKCVDECE